MGITLLTIAISVGIAWKIYGAGGKPLPVPEKLVKGSRNLWYVDEIYAAILLSPIYRVSRKVLWAIVDVRIIDGLVNGVAAGARWLGNLYSRTFHVGQTQGYALSLAIGSALLILFFAIG